MSYRHSKHAGNFGDVLKHLFLVETLKYLLETKAAARSRDFTFGYLETHAGEPLHQLKDGGSWEQGIGAYVDKHKEGVSSYFDKVVPRVRDKREYPSSWSLVLETIQDFGVENYNLTLFDTSAEVAQTMKSITSERIRYECKDGFKHYKDNSLQRVDLILIDPPYKTSKPNKPSRDWIDAAKAGEYLLSRGVLFLIWYPYFEAKQPGILNRRLEQPVLELMLPRVPSGEGLMKGAGLVFGGIDPKFVDTLHSRFITDLLDYGVLSKPQ